jgi:hypothetical protein
MDSGQSRIRNWICSRIQFWNWTQSSNPIRIHDRIFTWIRIYNRHRIWKLILICYRIYPYTDLQSDLYHTGSGFATISGFATRSEFANGSGSDSGSRFGIRTGSGLGPLSHKRFSQSCLQNKYLNGEKIRQMIKNICYTPPRYKTQPRGEM